MAALSHRPVPVTIPACGVAVAESIHAPSFHMADRAEPFHKVVFVRAGAIHYIRLDAASTSSPPAPLRLEAGGLLAIPQGLRHRFDDLTPATLFFLCLSTDWLAADLDRAALWHRLVSRRQPAMTPDQQARRGFDALTRRMLAEQLRAEIGWAAAVVGDALRWLVDLARLPDNPVQTDAPARVAAVLARLRETFYDPWTLNDAAEAAGLSRRRFTQLFTGVSGGASFLEYLTELRLDHATNLLARPDHSIAGAAFSSGFNDLSHFYRVFRQRHGLAPGRWRERNSQS